MYRRNPFVFSVCVCVTIDKYNVCIGHVTTVEFNHGKTNRTTLKNI